MDKSQLKSTRRGLFISHLRWWERTPKRNFWRVFEKMIIILILVRRTQEGCGGLGGESPAAFPKARPIFQQPFSLPESAQTLAGIAFRAARKSVRNFPAASKFARKLFQQGISDSHSLLEFSDLRPDQPQKMLWGAASESTVGFLSSPFS